MEWSAGGGREKKCWVKSVSHDLTNVEERVAKERQGEKITKKCRTDKISCAFGDTMMKIK